MPCHVMYHRGQGHKKSLCQAFAARDLGLQRAALELGWPSVSCWGCAPHRAASCLRLFHWESVAHFTDETPGLLVPGHGWLFISLENSPKNLKLLVFVLWIFNVADLGIIFYFSLFADLSINPLKNSYMLKVSVYKLNLCILYCIVFLSICALCGLSLKCTWFFCVWVTSKTTLRFWESAHCY